MKTAGIRKIGWHLLVTALLALAAIGWPGRAAAAGEGPPGGWVPVEPAQLAAMRGGYALPSGLVVSFGFERQAWVNGELVASLQVDIPDVAAMTGAQAQALAELREAQRVQVGPGNFAAPDGGGAGLVLQNTLDGALIRVQTTVDAGTNALGLLQAMNFADALGQAGSAAVGSP